MFLLARSWGIQPSDFWDMTLPEWWAEYDYHAIAQPGDFAGGLTQGDLDDIDDWLDEQAKKDLKNADAED